MRAILYLVAGLAVMFGVLVFLSLTGLVHAWKVPTGSMAPTIKPGDCIYSENITYHFRKPRRGEIVCFSINGLNGVVQPEPSPKKIVWEKRVIGLPGDRLELRYGEVLVNGKADSVVTSLKISPGRAYLTGDGDSVLVPANSYFVVGDNTFNSYDSRYWGFVPEKHIVGRAVLIYWPLSRFGRL